MTELELCPFCGGEAHTIEPARYGKSWGVRCECGAFLGFEYTEAEAIAAWNSRAVRTCECVADYAESPFDGKTIVLHRCSACHELMRPHMAYCPNCGAKVIERNEQ